MISATGVARRGGATMLALAMGAAFLVTMGGTAQAAIVPTVPLGTSAHYVVLGGQTVTNTGPSTLNSGLGLWPGTSITGFPPGLVLPPGATDTTNAAAQQAQSDLTAAYDSAAGRPVDTTGTSELANLALGAGVYSGPGKSPLLLSGPLVLDGAGDTSSVFIFQTDSTLITASGSTVTLINGAQECNVFWQVGSSATLGSGSVFTGNIMALTSITVNSGVTVHGRALARNGSVTLINDTFTRPACITGSESSGNGDGSSTSVAVPGTGTDLTSATPGGPSVPGGPGVPGVPGVVGPPRTGGAPMPTGDSTWLAILFAGLLVGAGGLVAVRTRRQQVLASVDVGSRRQTQHP